MRTFRTVCVAAFACAAVAGGLILGAGHAADPARAAPLPTTPARLVVHEWGTFTSFSGADGVPVGFRPNNTDLPEFVYVEEGDPNSKAARLDRDGTVSMETPVIYFYTDAAVRASVRVGFPRGWITEWYPVAAARPAPVGGRAPGQTIRWDVKLLPGEAVRFPQSEKEKHYARARETDAVPVEAEFAVPEGRRDGVLRGGSIVQREKFLFYRGVGTFPPPVAVRPLGGDRVRVTNTAGGRVGGLVLVTVRDGKVGFRAIDALDTGAETVATLPDATGTATALADVMVKELTAAGLYEKEARAMVKTWDAAWFGEDGSRLLYLVPRARTDELLPLTVDPKPTEVVRVLVGRHDFLTPEQEAEADRQVRRERAARAELAAADAALRKIGRFHWQARQMADNRVATGTAQK